MDNTEYKLGKPSDGIDKTWWLTAAELACEFAMLEKGKRDQRSALIYL